MCRVLLFSMLSADLYAKKKIGHLFFYSEALLLKVCILRYCSEVSNELMSEKKQQMLYFAINTLKVLSFCEIKNAQKIGCLSLKY